MPGCLDGKVAFITGGAGGMGQATTLRFLDEGARVVFGDIKPGDETLALARKDGHAENVRFVHVDVTDEGQIEAGIAFTRGSFGRLDCVYANAGATCSWSPLLDLPAAEFDRSIAINLRSIFLTWQYGGRALRDQGEGGSMIATSSIAAIVKLSAPAVYAASKAAVIQLTKELAAELGPVGIRVNCIAPGAILTPMYGADAREKWGAMMRDMQPLPVQGEAADIANMALFLASDQARFVTGATMTVDGGAVADGGHMFMDQYKRHQAGT